MFKNVSGKIKDFAAILCWIGIVLSVIIGIVVMADNTMVGVAVATVGSLSAWIVSYLVYGFGELVENSKKTADNSETIKTYLMGVARNKAPEVKPQFSGSEKTDSNLKKVCPNCKNAITGYLDHDAFCPWCGSRM